MFEPRPKQREVLSYTGGKMGVVAVPGSGKTLVLSSLAAEIVASGVLEDDQEVLIVTLVNSAVDNFTRRVGYLVQQRRLLPQLGYRVRTLHGLAHDIVRERPELVQLSDNFQIVDERAAEQIQQDVALAWLRSHPGALDNFLDPEMEEGKLDWVRREWLPDLVVEIASAFIRFNKDRRLTPIQLQEQLEGLPVPLPLAEMGCAIYNDYQRALAYRGAVDFDDLIRLALQALESDLNYLERLRNRWPYVLEDEAQDSSYLQEKILRLLVGEDGNWVRVGDPNQAIYETFTTASPQYLRDFKHESHLWREMPNSGRSTQSIIDLANELIRWTQQDHAVEAVRGALTTPSIEPTPSGDPQPNPPDDPSQVHLVTRKLTPAEEIRAIADSLQRWLSEHSEETVAVLSPRNVRGFELVNELKRRGIEYNDSLLRSTTETRLAAGALGNVVSCLADPQSASKLAIAYRVWRRAGREDGSEGSHYQRAAELLRKCRQVEDYLWPRADHDWLVELALVDSQPEVHQELLTFRDVARRWQGTILLPIDQIILTLAQDLFTEPTDLAIAHKLAVILRRASESHLNWRLPDLTEELASVARNERRFLGFSEDDTGFDPDKYKGKVVVATMHKAKGLEWGRVYLMSVNNYDFPSGTTYDTYISEPWFVRGKLNLVAETLAQVDAAFSIDEFTWHEEGQATQKARLDYISERLRLLYVGITRAKKELIITWNSGRKGELQPAMPFVALHNYWEKRLNKIESTDLRE